MAVNGFKQALHLPVSITQEHNIDVVSEVGNVDIRTNLNPWIAMQGLTRQYIEIKLGLRTFIQASFF